MLIDSNIIIYAMHPDYEEIRHLIEEKIPFVSAVSYVEVLGYHKLIEQERTYLEIFLKPREFYRYLKKFWIRQLYSVKNTK